VGGCLLCTWGGEEMWPFARRAGGRASLTRLRGAERSMAAKAAPPPPGTEGKGKASPARFAAVNAYEQ
jgi:hypothetical protein